MAKKDKDSTKKALSSGNLYSQEALSQLVTLVGKQADTDEILRRAGISRSKLDIILRDDEVGQATETRIDALLGNPYRLEPSDSKEAELLTAELNNWYFEIIGNSLNALFFGYAVQEVVYAKKEGYIGLGEVIDQPIEWFEPRRNKTLVYRQDGTGSDQIVDTKFKFFLTRRKASSKNPYGRALLADLYWLWFFKQNTWKFWAKYLERFGTPILLGKVSGNAEGGINDMLNAMLSAHSQSVIAIDSEDSVEVLSAGSSGTAGASFDNFNQTIIRQIQKVVLGQTLTSGTDGTGSRALGEVHENVRKDKLKSDIRLVQPTVQDIVNALCALNGWQPHKVIMGEEKSLESDKADRDVKLKNAGAVLTPQYFQREYGLQDGDVTVDATPAPTQFNHIPKQAFSFAASVNSLSQAQKEVEQLTDDQKDLGLLTVDQIKELLKMSDSPQSLTKNLMEIVPNATATQFKIQLEQALYAADILGYVTASQESK